MGPNLVDVGPNFRPRSANLWPASARIWSMSVRIGPNPSRGCPRLLGGGEGDAECGAKSFGNSPPNGRPKIAIGQTLASHRYSNGTTLEQRWYCAGATIALRLCCPGTALVLYWSRLSTALVLLNCFGTARGRRLQRSATNAWHQVTPEPEPRPPNLGAKIRTTLAPACGPLARGPTKIDLVSKVTYWPPTTNCLPLVACDWSPAINRAFPWPLTPNRRPLINGYRPAPFLTAYCYCCLLLTVFSLSPTAGRPPSTGRLRLAACDWLHATGLRPPAAHQWPLTTHHRLLLAHYWPPSPDCLLRLPLAAGDQPPALPTLMRTQAAAFVRRMLSAGPHARSNETPQSNAWARARLRRPRPHPRRAMGAMCVCCRGRVNSVAGRVRATRGRLREEPAADRWFWDSAPHGAVSQ